VAGLTVGAMLIPQSMGYAELAGVPPQYGFYAAIPALVVYALIGTSRHLGVGPEPGTAILAASGVGAIVGAEADPQRYASLMAVLALTVAAVCVLGFFLRLGYFASMLSKPVLVGYISGVGIALLGSQIAGMTGLRISADSFAPRVWHLLTHVSEVSWTTLALGLATLALILAARSRVPTVPGALLGVILAAVVAALFSLDDHGVALIGSIPQGLPRPEFPSASWDDVTRLVPVALGISLVGFTDNVLTARAVAAGRGYRIDANREILALGMTNLAAGLSQGFPLSSSASRTAVPASLGSRTQLVSLIASAFAVVTILALHAPLSQIPRAALAAVIVAAAVSIIDISGFASLWRVSRTECGLAIITTVGVVAFGVFAGIVIAVALSIAVAFSQIARPHDAVLGDMPDVDGWVDVGEHPSATTTPGLLVFRFDAPLFFVNAERFSDRLDEVLSENPGDEEWLVIDCEGIGAVDASAIDMMRDVTDRLPKQGVEMIALARANDRVLSRLTRAGLLEPTGPLRTFPTINAAVRAFDQRPE
jgi:high affinity sulfate transporter 1